MYSPWHSQWTTVRSCLALGTRPSSCGTRSLSASTPSRMMATVTGCLASASHPIMPTPSLCLLVGTAPLRFVVIFFLQDFISSEKYTKNSQLCITQ